MGEKVSAINRNGRICHKASSSSRSSLGSSKQIENYSCSNFHNSSPPASPFFSVLFSQSRGEKVDEGRELLKNEKWLLEICLKLAAREGSAHSTA